MQTNKTKNCASCGQTKPLSNFQRRLTLAQTRAHLRNPNIQTRFTTISKNCAVCRNAKRRKKPLSASEIRTKISTGDIRPMLGEAMLKQMREDLPRKRSKVMKEYWQKKKTEPIEQTKKNIQKQTQSYGNKYHSYKSAIAKQTKPTTPAQHALLEQHRYNYEEAQRVREELFKQLESGTAVPKDVKINELIKRRKVGQSNEVF